MYTEPMIFPLDFEGKLYVLQDADGKIVGTGTRKVCEALKALISKPANVPDKTCAKVTRRSNIKSATGF